MGRASWGHSSRLNRSGPQSREEGGGRAARSTAVGVDVGGTDPEIGIHHSRPDSGQMSIKMDVCVCGGRSRFFSGECSPLIGTGRHFVGLRCRTPLPIPPLIRIRPTRSGTGSAPGLWRRLAGYLRRLQTENQVGPFVGGVEGRHSAVTPLVGAPAAPMASTLVRGN